MEVKTVSNVVLLFNSETQWQEYAYFHMLYIPSDLWNYMSSFIIHIGGGVITICPVRLATDTINIMKSQFAQGVAAAVKSGHNWLVSTGMQYTGDKH